MTAIAGVWQLDGAPGAARGLRSMLEALHMYGHERRGLSDCGVAALGICFMKLLPEDRHDTQPLAVIPGKVWMVADVRLDNRAELIGKLGLPRGAAREQSDADLLRAAWLRWDEASVHHLAGAFSFAVWDCSRPRLFVARDHSGQRPLFYHVGRGFCAFASMPKGLMALPAIEATLDEEQLALHVALAPTPRERTLFAGIDRLPPGHCLSVTAEATRLTQYWQPTDAPQIRYRNDADYLEAFRECLDRAVDARLRAITPVASHLSGGLDSSSVTATAARLLAAQGRELLALTAVPRRGFDAGQHVGHFGDEGPAAAAVAAMYPNIRHRCVGSQAYSFLQVIHHNTELDDRPVFNPTNGMWINAIRDLLRAQGIQVLLIGQFGNATISYTGMNALSEWFRHGQWWTLARLGTKLIRNGTASARSVAAHALRPSLPRRMQRLLTPSALDLDHSLVNPSMARDLRLQQRYGDGIAVLGNDRMATARSLFRRADSGEMRGGALAGWHIDERDPTRDRRVIEFCFGIPAEQFLHGGQTRALVRRGMRGRLPEATLQRRERGQQAADWHLSMAAERDAMQQELAQIATSPIAQRCLDLTRMQELIEQWPSANFEHRAIFARWHYGLTRGLSVGHFIRRFDPQAASGAASSSNSARRLIST